MAKKNTVEIILAAKDMASKATQKAFGTIQSSAQSAMSTVAKASGAAVVALGAVSAAVGRVGVQYNAMMEQSEIAWSTILGSTEKAKETLKELQIMGAKTPFEFEGLDKAAKLLNMAGFEGDKLFTTLTNVGDAVSAVGGSQEELQGVSMAIFQMASKGKVSAEEMNQLAERGIPAWKMIGDEMGKSVAELMEMSQNGELFANDVLPLLIDGMGNEFGGAMDKQSKTFNGMLSTLRDNLKILSAEISKGLFEKLKKGMEQALPVLDAFTEFAKGNMVKFTEILTKAFGVDSAVKIINFSLAIKKGMDTAKQALDMVKSTVEGVFSVFRGNTGKGTSIFTNMGLSPDTIKMVIDSIQTVKSTIMGYFNFYVSSVKSLFSGDGNLGQSFMRMFEVIKSIALPILQDAIEFVKSTLAELKAFWDENGAQIIQAVKNMWSIIASIWEAMAPVVLFILKLLFDSIKGVISGALNIIMGVIKVFTGLFTGDFSKMWEGVKQLFVGAVEFLWNLINLMMVGRILGGIKALVTKGVSAFTGFWTKTVEIFKNLDTHVWGIINSFVGKVIGTLKGFYTQGAQIFGTLRTYGASVFNALGQAIRTVAGSIYNSVIGYFKSMYTGVSFRIQGIWNTATSIFSKLYHALTAPVESAKNTILTLIDRIKKAFNFSWSLPKLKLPKVSVSMKENGWGIPVPDFDVSWHKTGGVFTKPVIYGNSGFGDVEEGIIPFEGPHAKRIAGLIANEMPQKSGNTYNVTINASNVDIDENRLVRTLQRMEVLYG
jgi:tape measure domain-containing protein